MKLSDLRPCAKCGGKLPPIWYVIKTSMAILNQRATNEVLGLHQYFGGQSGHSLALTEVMAPNADGAVLIAGEKDPACWVTFNLCQNCYLGGPVELALIQEKMGQAEVGG